MLLYKQSGAVCAVTKNLTPLVVDDDLLIASVNRVECRLMLVAIHEFAISLLAEIEAEVTKIAQHVVPGCQQMFDLPGFAIGVIAMPALKAVGIDALFDS